MVVLSWPGRVVFTTELSGRLPERHGLAVLLFHVVIRLVTTWPGVVLLVLQEVLASHAELRCSDL